MLKVLLTGHSRGLGGALCQALAARGADILGVARHDTVTLTPRLTHTSLDLADASALASWLASDTLTRHFGDASTAVLINNAGSVEPMGDDRSLAPAAISHTVALNVAAPLMLGAAFLAATGHCHDRRLLHISSGAARSPYAGWSVYCATKAALDQHARALHAAALPGLRVESLAPGVIDTAMQAVIRASDPAGFPRHARFIALHAEGQLQSADATATQLVAHLLGERFGNDPVSDLRTLSTEKR